MLHSESLERVIRKAESLDPREFTAESWEAVSAALAEAKGVWQEEGASRAELETVLLKLIQAYDGLEYGVQKVHLETVMDFVDQRMKLENNYEPEDIEALKAARENGKAVYDDPQASQEEADAARGLKLRGNKAALRAMIAKAEEILSSKEAYVPSSIETLEEILQMAKKVDLTQDALQEEIDGAEKTLTETVAKARLLGDVDGDGTVNTADAVGILQYSAERIAEF